MDSKAVEYAPFDYRRARNIFHKLQKFLNLNTYNIHIIGTNGKGSTGRFIAQSLWESKHSVLHFTSPHLFEFRERFYLNNDIISLESLEIAHTFLQQFDFIREASYFEYATFLALVLGQTCDFLIMEAGVGGEYDSTSILTYHITIFTRIGMDHKEMLGDSIQSIASTKLRAAQGVIFTHFQNDEVLALVQQLHVIAPQKRPYAIHYLNPKDRMTQVVQEYAKKYALPLFLQENLALANLVVSYLNIPLLTNMLCLIGRCEIIRDNIIIDVGHNEMAASVILAEAKRYFNNEKFILIYNSYKEKEIEKILHIFKKSIIEVILFQVDNPRIIDFAEIQLILYRLHIPHRLFNPNETKGLDPLSKNLIEYKDFFLESRYNYVVFGSFSLVESFLRWFYDSIR